MFLKEIFRRLRRYSSENNIEHIELSIDDVYTRFEQDLGKIEISFYFRTDLQKRTHSFEYFEKLIQPYWASAPDGSKSLFYPTTRELFEAKIFDGESLRESWPEFVITDQHGMR